MSSKKWQGNWNYYKQLIKKFGVKEYEKRLREIISSSKVEFGYLGLKNLREIRKIKDRILKELA